MTYEERREKINKLKQYGYDYKGLAKLFGLSNPLSFNSSSARDRYIDIVFKIVERVEHAERKKERSA